MKKKTVKPSEPLRGEKLAKHVINKILANPESWEQSKWHCGTQHCFFGHCQIEAGFPKKEEGVLSRPERTLIELYQFVRAGYDCYGYDSDGYNSDGYNRDGYDRAGYDRAGYNRDGYNRNGYDCYGYDRAGYDCYGYDSDGYNRNGEKLELIPFVIE